MFQFLKECLRSATAAGNAWDRRVVHKAKSPREKKDLSRFNSFAAKTAHLNAFLFADVGVESNGSILTINSTLARLGKDPWDEAMRLAREPEDRAVASLSADIVGMTSATDTFENARSAARPLIRLLPRQVIAPATNVTAPDRHLSTVPHWQWIIFGWFWLSLAFNAGHAFAPKIDAFVASVFVQTSMPPNISAPPS